MIIHKSLPLTFLLLLGGMVVVSTSIPLNWADWAFIPHLFPALFGIMLSSYMLIRIEAEYHAYKFDNKESVNHALAWIIRGAVSAVLCSVFHAHYWNLLKILNLMVFSAFWFGLIFNPALNMERELPFFYIGKDWKEGSTIDMFFNNFKHGGEILYLLMVIGFCVSAYLYQL